MAETRRTYTPEDKQKILAHLAGHGPKVTAEHFNVATSMISRWRHKAAETASKPTKPVQRKKGQWRRKKWTNEKIAAVLAFRQTHTHKETKKRFNVGSSQLSLWSRGFTRNPYERKRPVATRGNGHSAGPLGVMDLPAKDALMWLERYYAAYLRQVRQEAPGPVDLYKILSRGDK